METEKVTKPVLVGATVKFDEHEVRTLADGLFSALEADSEAPYLNFAQKTAFKLLYQELHKVGDEFDAQEED